MLRQILALAFIFVCTTIAWVILGATIFSRTYGANEQLQGHVASTWGTAQEQSPPTAHYTVTDTKSSTTVENGKIVVREEKVDRDVPVPIQASRIHVGLKLDPRQKGLLWYTTYTVDFAGDYVFRNNTSEPHSVAFRLKFPAQKAIYDGLQMKVNDQLVPLATDEQGTVGMSTVPPQSEARLHVAYRSQGLDSWRYRLGDGISQSPDFQLVMQTNFHDIDFADDTLSPSSKTLIPGGWQMTWQYSNLVSGFQIGMTMPEKLQPGPLAGEISYAAPVSLFFFFFLIFIITTLRNIDLHPLNYFFLATAFFAFHLLLAYLVDHISIHAAMVLASVVSVALVVSYLRLVVGMRFAALEAGTAQLIYLVLFSYAFFWRGFTGLAITIIAIITLFVVMQATGRIRWSERFAARGRVPLPGAR
ncbi:MAG TPA: inner membrane CreD family protein [Candidatus Dormibacteraeota bacterium]|nr:inner membrane CreD family protein [Candidatus Dormibacteraeota bacterium]